METDMLFRRDPDDAAGWRIVRYRWPEKDQPAALVTVRGYSPSTEFSEHGEWLEAELFVPVGLTDRASIEAAVWPRLRALLERLRVPAPSP